MKACSGRNRFREPAIHRIQVVLRILRVCSLAQPDCLRIRKRTVRMLQKSSVDRVRVLGAVQKLRTARVFRRLSRLARGYIVLLISSIFSREHGLHQWLLCWLCIFQAAGAKEVKHLKSTSFFSRQYLSYTEQNRSGCSVCSWWNQ